MSEPNRAPAGGEFTPGKGKKPDKRTLLIGGAAVALVAGVALLHSKGGGGSGTGTTFSAPPTYSGDVNVPNYSAQLANIQDELARLDAERQQPGSGHHHRKHKDPDPKHHRRHRHPDRDRKPRRRRDRRGQGAQANALPTPPHFTPHALRPTRQAPRRRVR